MASHVNWCRSCYWRLNFNTSIYDKRIKEPAYTAIGVKYISAVIGHIAIDGFVPMSFSPLVVFALLLASILLIINYKN